MHAGERSPGGSELVDGPTVPAPDENLRTRPAARRWQAAAAWIAGGLVLFAFFLRISYGERVDSDGANSALQAWDLVHGHLMMHGWIFGDATFYAFELPLNGILELLFGVGNLAVHAGSALTYLIVTACAVALATTSGRGPARVVRAAVVVAVLAVPLLAVPTVWVLLEEPDHIGTSMFLLVCVLLIDRVPDRRFTAPLVGLILCAGQLSDATVRYVAVPAIVAICGYRVLAGRKLRSGDTALVVAAIVSVPLESALRAAMVHFGAFAMVPPKAQLASPRLWPQHASVVWLDVRILFGSASEPGHKLAVASAAFGLICLLAAIFGMDLARGEPGRAVAVRRDRLQRRHLHGLRDDVAQRLPGSRRRAAVRGGARGAGPGARPDQRDAAGFRRGRRDRAHGAAAARRRGHATAYAPAHRAAGRVA